VLTNDWKQMELALEALPVHAGTVREYLSQPQQIALIGTRFNRAGQC
jgi:hypothetical protein